MYRISKLRIKFIDNKVKKPTIEPFNNICIHTQNYFRVDTKVKQTAWEMYEIYNI